MKIILIITLSLILLFIALYLHNWVYNKTKKDIEEDFRVINQTALDRRLSSASLCRLLLWRSWMSEKEVPDDLIGIIAPKDKKQAQ